jgi:hypothetical protein
VIAGRIDADAMRFIVSIVGIAKEVRDGCGVARLSRPQPW